MEPTENGARIRRRRICEAEGVEVPYGDVARGYEAADRRTVVLSDSDLADLPLPAGCCAGSA
ncbi:Ku protein [Streptomyces lydicus]|uniref:Ku protein n=1 Tax=Streptomyces lydicus TaxID=47763 RepID=UPI0032200BA3